MYTICIVEDNRILALIGVNSQLQSFSKGIHLEFKHFISILMSNLPLSRYFRR